MGILGGGVAMAKPRAGGTMLLIGSIGMPLLIMYFGATYWVITVPMLMLLLAGVLALAAGRRRVPA